MEYCLNTNLDDNNSRIIKRENKYFLGLDMDIGYYDVFDRNIRRSREGSEGSEDNSFGSEEFDNGDSESEGGEVNSFGSEESDNSDSETEQQSQRADRLTLSSLTHEFDSRRKKLDKLRSMYEEKCMSIREMLEDRDDTYEIFFEEVRNLLDIARDQAIGVLEHQEMLNFEFENKRRRLDCWSEELEGREVALYEEKRRVDDLMREKNDVQLLYQHHLAKERLANDELLEVGKQLMKGLEDMPTHSRVKIGVKRKRETNLLSEAETKAVDLCCIRIRKLTDDDDGNPQRMLNENVKLLGGVKRKWGDKVYDAVVAALGYSTSGNGMDSEMWNLEEDRKATHSEVIKHIFVQQKKLESGMDVGRVQGRVQPSSIFKFLEKIRKKFFI